MTFSDRSTTPDPLLDPTESPVSSSGAELTRDTLIGEIQCYLEVVEFFRATGCDLRWA